MKKVFDKTRRDKLIVRTNPLNENRKAQWGSMTIYLMLKHFTLWEVWRADKKINKKVPGWELFYLPPIFS